MKVLQIGAGGIGSFLAGQIHKAYDIGQIPDDVEYDVCDHDAVEPKNIINGQEFVYTEIGLNKAQVLEKKYPFIHKAIKKKAGLKELEGYDVIILAVDNVPTRQMVFEYCEKKNIYYIDLRAEGRRAFAMSKPELVVALTTLNLNDSEPGGCQLGTDQNEKRVQYGFKLAALVGLQMFLNHLRHEPQAVSVWQQRI